MEGSRLYRRGLKSYHFLEKVSVTPLGIFLGMNQSARICKKRFRKLISTPPVLEPGFILTTLPELRACAHIKGQQWEGGSRE